MYVAISQRNVTNVSLITIRPVIQPGARRAYSLVGENASPISVFQARRKPVSFLDAPNRWFLPSLQTRPAPPQIESTGLGMPTSSNRILNAADCALASSSQTIGRRARSMTTGRRFLAGMAKMCRREDNHCSSRLFSGILG